MALQKQYLEVPIVGGIDEANDAYLSTRPRLVENGRYERDGAVSKRFGSAIVRSEGALALGDPYVTFPQPPQPPQPPHVHIAAVRDEELVQVSGGKLFSQSDVLAQPVFRALVPSVVAERLALPAAPDRFWSPQVAETSTGYLVYLWLGDQDPASPNYGRVFACVIDKATGAMVFPVTRIDGGALALCREPRLLVHGDRVVSLFRDSLGNLYAQSSDFGSGIAPSTWFQTPTIIHTDLTTAFVSTYDADFEPTSGSRFYVSYVKNAGAARLVWFAHNPTTLALVTSGASVFPNVVGEEIQRVSLSAAQPDRVWVIFALKTAGTSSLRNTSFNVTTLAELAGPFTIVFSSTVATRLTCLAIAPNECVFAASLASNETYTGRATAGGGAPQTFLTATSTVIASRPFLRGAHVYALVCEVAASTLYLCNIFNPAQYSTTYMSMRPVATLAKGIGTLGEALPPLQAASSLPDIVANADRSRLTTVGIIHEPGLPARAIVAPLAFEWIAPDVVDQQGIVPLTSAMLGRNLHLACGVPSFYDGNILGDIGFAREPLIVATRIVASGGAIAIGTYNYIATYEYTDAQGQVHRSPPSAAVTITTTVAGSVVELDVSRLGLTMKQTLDTQRSTLDNFALLPAIAIVVYRTANLGTVFHRVSPDNSTTLNDPTLTGPVTFRDTGVYSDLILLTRPLLYTTGGVLDNVAPPSARVGITHKNRLWLAGCDDPKRIWFSKEFTEGEGLGFNELLTFSVDDGGAITALGSLDDKLIVFKDSTIYAVFGSGPNDLGQGADLSLPQRLASDVGCIEPRSVISTSAGLFFQSAKGIYLLTRGLELTFIGKEIDDILGAFPVVTAANISVQTNEVRFELNGCRLAYDYSTKAWTKATTDPAASACEWRDIYTWITPIGDIEGETPTQFTDPNGHYQMTLETSWIKPAGVQGFQRVWRIGVLGRTESPDHDLLVDLAFDYDPTWVQSATFPSTLWATGYPEQAIVHVAQQKCESIKLRVRDAVTEGSGRSVTITSLALTVGIKGGIERKLPATNRG